MSRHSRIRNTSLFQEQVRIRALAQIISEDIVYLLERREIEAGDDPELKWLHQHGSEVMTDRIVQNIERLRDVLTVVKRKLPRKAD